MNSLAKGTAMVTGGATGIGAAIVEELAARGLDVACCYNKSGAAADELARRLGAEGKSVFPVQMDVTMVREVQSAVDVITEHFGRPITILVNNAGDIVGTAPTEAMDVALWDKVLSINLRGSFLCAKYCIPGMKEAGWGRIINIGSQSARSGGGAGSVHYVASKGGVEAFTRALSRELAPFHITVNTVAPGDIYTPIHERHNTPESLELMRQNIPLGRLGEPHELAKVVGFIASDDSSYMTGAMVAVNGGKRLD